MRRIAFLLASLGSAAVAVAGPYTEAGIAAGDARFVGFATGVSALVRGPIDATNPSAGLATQGDASGAIGAPGNGVVSLGDGGSITVTFARPIVDGAGADFAVFENGFASGAGLFAELGFVEVSSNGTDFARFAAISRTQTATQVGAFETIDPTDVRNLAGKHAGGTGTPFDLAELVGLNPAVDVNAIRYVRVVDVVGSIDPKYGARDSLGTLINDPFTTPYASGGFDLDAVGVINVPEPTAALAAGGLALALRRRRAR